MDLDNPSYFSMPEEKQTYAGSKRRIRMGNSESISSASDCSLSRQSTPPRRQYRTFLRSVSSNSADSNQERLITGEPRLADIAPDLAFKHPASRSNSLKTRADPHGDSMYFPLPTSEEAAELSGDEVFLAEDTARYYNFSAIRRHSISNFMGRERTSSVTLSMRSFPEEWVNTDKNSTTSMDDHSLRHASYPRKRCLKCVKAPASKTSNMDDILIVSLKSSDAATLWVDYFSNYFQQISKQAKRKPFKIHHLRLEDINNSPNDVNFIEHCSGVKLQLVVLCPSFLEYISENSEQSAVLSKVLLPDRTLALLLGVCDDDLLEIHKKTLSTYFQWQRQMVGQDQDENFTKEFLSQAMGILSKVWKQQSSVLAQEKSCFSVTPKKIRHGQNSVFILLTHPLQKEDIIKISVERNGDLQEIKSVKRRNPYTMKISVPEPLTEVTSIVNVLVEKNGSIIGSRPIKCESKLRELEQILRSANNPVEFMCQAIGFSPADKDQLDNWLVHGFQRNLPPHFNLLANHTTPFGATTHIHKHSHEEFPTLLHFASKFGLEKLAMQLLDCPGADTANEIRNHSDFSAVDIADANGHSDLANMLRGYMTMNELSTAFKELEKICGDQKTTDVVDEEGYLTPKQIEDYKICPKPRPVLLQIPVVTNTSEGSTPIGYMAMHTPATKDDSAPKPSDSTLSETTYKTKKEMLDSKAKSIKNKKDWLNEDRFQKELAEIIMDYKNNVHSIGQVEKLVHEWINRNDVQKSFKEKQEKLAQMRLQYDQLQYEMKNSMKKSSPFDRLMKLFNRSKSREEKVDISLPVQTATVQRPISSLSTSSSGSSGRMSTLSGYSLGDSGTHSDNEERKNNMLRTPNEEDFRNIFNKAVMELNYTPLPAPKPVKTGMLPNPVFETIEEKPLPKPDNQLTSDNFYIQFPPSGLPVPGLEQIGKQDSSKEYMNVTTGGEPLEQHDYMNFKIPSTR